MRTGTLERESGRSMGVPKMRSRCRKKLDFCAERPLGRFLRPGMKVRAWVADWCEDATVVEVCEHGAFVRWDDSRVRGRFGDVHGCTWDMMDLSAGSAVPNV